ncbi:MAG: polysaccharide pyruvyl transferase family protein [Bacteroidales bacterium]|nr:polysaccharide pyruvyl transferase family protein [Bacteroidales bacterium]
MKIGIVTFEFNYNYGAILQATALQDMLQSLGHKVEIVNRGWNDDSKRTKNKFRYLISKFLGKFYTLREINRYKKEHLNISRKVSNDKEIRELFKEYDIIFFGSDQIWNSDCIKNMGLYYYGIHVDTQKTRMIAYAPSFGQNSFNASPEIRKAVSNLFNKYTAISTREEDGLYILKDLFNIEKAVKVLDPTMLHDVDYYHKLANIKNKKLTNNTLAYYLLDKTEKKLETVYRLAAKLGLKPININVGDENINCKFKFIRKLQSLKYPSIENWLRNISEANFIITDSFHGTVFSIIFNKQFLTFGNDKRGNSRFINILSMLDLKDNLFIDSEINIDNIPSVNYDIVNKKLKLFKEESINFINNSLK